MMNTSPMPGTPCPLAFQIRAPTRSMDAASNAVTSVLYPVLTVAKLPVGFVATGALILAHAFVALSAGNYLGGRVASLYEAFSLPQLFGVVALFAAGAAVVLALLIKPIQRMLERSRP